jgi:hypothetical protein
MRALGLNLDVFLFDLTKERLLLRRENGNRVGNPSDKKDGQSSTHDVEEKKRGQIF